MFEAIDPAQAEYRLKFKYRNRVNIPAKSNGSYKARTGNSHGKDVSVHVNVRPRMRSYYGAANRQSV
jgi:hypothetical protein